MEVEVSQLLIRYSRILEIIGDIVKVQVPASEASSSQISFGDLALIEGSTDNQDVLPRTAQVILLKGEEVSLQVFSGTKGLSTHSVVRFLGRPMEVTFSPKDRKSTRLNSSHVRISYAVFCLKKK